MKIILTREEFENIAKDAVVQKYRAVTGTFIQLKGVNSYGAVEVIPVNTEAEEKEAD